jgi:SAM-dependent methyltransferase
MYRTPDMSVHVHLWQADSSEIERHLAFRDWLRSHPADRALYEHVKRKLAEREWADRNDYAQAKTPVINAIMRRANGQKAGPRIDDFARIIRQYVPSPARILEIGAGEGELAHKLTASGYHAIALDRFLRSTFPIVESSFEEYAGDPNSFDCVAAQLVLHHVDDLDATLEKAASLLRAGGMLAIDDYGWERSDDPEFRADRADLHSSQTMLRALRAHFNEIAYFDHAYFDEGAGTDRLGFTFIGRRLH